MTQKMHGPSDQYCPLWRKAMSKVCHTCAWWTEVPITQEGRTTSLWTCAQVANVIYGLDTVAAARGTQAAVEKRGDETIKVVAEGIMRQERQHNEAMGSISDVRATPQHQVASNGASPPKLLSAGDN